MNRLQMMTSLGLITIRETQGRLVSLDFARRREADEPSDLLLRAAEQIESYLQGQRTTFDLPLSGAGTLMARKVRCLLRAVPYGETRTYGWLARALSPTSHPRAVGTVLGRNPLPIIVPCHRIVRCDGTPGGYRGGVDNKEILMRLERACYEASGC